MTGPTLWVMMAMVVVVITMMVVVITMMMAVMTMCGGDNLLYDSLANKNLRDYLLQTKADDVTNQYHPMNMISLTVLYLNHEACT